MALNLISTLIIQFFLFPVILFMMKVPDKKDQLQCSSKNTSDNHLHSRTKKSILRSINIAVISFQMISTRMSLNARITHYYINKSLINKLPVQRKFERKILSFFFWLTSMCTVVFYYSPQYQLGNGYLNSCRNKY
jgi:hypothetical protein